MQKSKKKKVIEVDNKLLGQELKHKKKFCQAFGLGKNKSSVFVLKLDPAEFVNRYFISTNINLKFTTRKTHSK